MITRKIPNSKFSVVRDDEENELDRGGCCLVAKRVR